jgi:hypothetical protein
MLRDQKLTDVDIRIPATAPVRISCVEGEQRGPYFDIQWLSSLEAGWHRYTVEIGSKTIEDELCSTILIAANVLPTVDVFPRSILLTEIPENKGEVLRTIHLAINGDTSAKSFDFGWKDSRFATAFEVQPTGQEQKDCMRFVLKVRDLDAIHELWGMTGWLVLRLNRRDGDTETLTELPVYCGLSGLGSVSHKD